jgi:hypothetical protein
MHLQIAMRHLLLLAACVLALPGVAHAAQTFGPYGPLSNCSGTVGGTAANIAFPSSGTASPPSNYVYLKNSSTSSEQYLWFNITQNPTATTAPPSSRLAPNESVTFSSANAPIPPVISVIGSGSGVSYTCWYN